MASTSKDDRPDTWNNKRRGKTPNYKYSTVQEVYDNSIPHNSTCNIYGVVADLKEPEKSQGTDHYALVFVVDDTSQEPLRIRLFHRDTGFFPKVSVGDIIRFHRLKVYKTIDLTLTSQKGWSWVLWSAKDRDDPFKREKSSSDSYTLLKNDKEIVERLREWQKTSTSAEPNKNFKRLSEIKHRNYVCLLCKVLAFKQLSSSHLIVKVLDGTIPTTTFYRFQEFNQDIVVDFPDNYIVDVVLYNDHVAHWIELDVQEGSYILLRNLHAWPNPMNSLNSNSRSCSELSLHAGTANGRGLELAEDDEALDFVKSDIAAVRRASRGEDGPDESSKNSTMVQSSPNPEKDQHSQNSFKTLTGTGVRESETSQAGKCPSPSAKRAKHSDEFDEQNVDFMESNVVDGQSDSKRNRLSQSFILSGLPTEENSSQPSTNTESPETEVLRCLQESVTVVTGEGVPLKLTELSKVIKYEVPLHSSKLFRVRVHLQSCATPPELYVGHYSPVTGIFFPSENKGEQLSITDEVKAFVDAWRQVRGIDQTLSDVEKADSQAFSQWELPSSGGETSAVNMKTYDCARDGSRWESMETEEHVIRKRKCAKDRFNILYILQSSDYTPDVLQKYGQKYNRVIRSVPSDLLSTEPPAVGIQKDVFYYSCPANVMHPSVPSLQDEAEQFIENRISHAMGSPTLVPRFLFNFILADGSGTIEDVMLTGQNAIEFLCGTTPQSYLANEDDVVDSVRNCMKTLLGDSSIFECILEKKSRRRTNGEHDQNVVYIYSICNTSLKLS